MSLFFLLKLLLARDYMPPPFLKLLFSQEFLSATLSLSTKGQVSPSGYFKIGKSYKKVKFLSKKRLFLLVSSSPPNKSIFSQNPFHFQPTRSKFLSCLLKIPSNLLIFRLQSFSVFPLVL